VLNQFFSNTPISIPVVVPEAENINMNGFAWSIDFGIMVAMGDRGDIIVDELFRLRNPMDSSGRTSEINVDPKWNTNGVQIPGGIEQSWQQTVGKKNIQMFPSNVGSVPKYFNGFIDKAYMKYSGILDFMGSPIYLRADASSSLGGLMTKLIKQDSSFSSSIITHYLSYEAQKENIVKLLRANQNQIMQVCQMIKCPAGTNDHGWGIAIDFDPRIGNKIDETIMNEFGWSRDATGDGGNNPNHWLFVGNHLRGWPTYITPDSINEADQNARGEI